MEEVFCQSVEAQICAGGLQVLRTFMRELVDLPGSLIQAHWRAHRMERENMKKRPAEHPDRPGAEHRQPGSWEAAILAGLPHLLMGLLMGTGLLINPDHQESFQTVAAITGVILAFVVMGILAAAWRRSWPTWSASWYLYGTWVVLAALELGIEALNLEESWRYTNGLFFGWIFTCIVGYFAILTRSRLHGLLSVLFLFPLLGIMYLEFIPDAIEGWLAICLGILAGLTAGVVVRCRDFRIGFGAALGLNLIAGLLLAYVGEYQMKDLPGNMPAHIPNPGNFLDLLALYSLFGLGVIAIPFILRGLVGFTRRNLMP
jgi:hypothetical protein